MIGTSMVTWVAGGKLCFLHAAARHSLSIASKFALLFVCCASFAWAADDFILSEFAGALDASELIPGADRLGPVETISPVMPVYKGDEQLGYAFITSDFVNTNGYS